MVTRLRGRRPGLWLVLALGLRQAAGLPGEDGFGQVVQGTLEASNVEIVQEMVDMITAQRAYEVNSKAIKTAEEMIQTATNELIR